MPVPKPAPWADTKLSLSHWPSHPQACLGDVKMQYELTLPSGTSQRSEIASESTRSCSGQTLLTWEPAAACSKPPGSLLSVCRQM